MAKPYLILDTHYLCHRARYAMGSELTYKGTPTTIIYGFLKGLIVLQEQFRTSKLLFCFDSKASHRKKLYPDYKKKRHSKELTEEELDFEKAFRYQIKKLRTEYLPEIGYRNIYRESGFESDDLIAALCIKIAKKERKGIIITADHDMYQCISPFISCYNPHAMKELTLQGFKKEFGIIPEQWFYIKAIAGCSTDGVEGIKGVGEKTAIKFVLNELKETSKAYQNIKSKEGAKIIDRNIPLVLLPMKNTPKLRIQKDELSIDGWKKVCKRLGMKSIRDENPFPWRKVK